MISTQHALDGVTVTTSTRVEGKVRISLDHQYFDTNKVHLSPEMARKVAADLVACAASCEAFNAGAGGHVLASPQRTCGHSGSGVKPGRGLFSGPFTFHCSKAEGSVCGFEGCPGAMKKNREGSLGSQQGTARAGFLIVLAGAAVTWGFLGYSYWQYLGR